MIRRHLQARRVDDDAEPAAYPSRAARNQKRLHWLLSPCYALVATLWLAAYLESNETIHLVLAFLWIALAVGEIATGFIWRSTERIRLDIEATHARIQQLTGLRRGDW